MIRAALRFCSSVAYAALICVAAAEQLSAQDEQATGRIAGTVIDGTTGRPIGGASIEVLGAATPVRSATDVEGRYRTRALPAGLHRIQVSMIGYASTRVDSVRVVSGEVAAVPVVLQPQAIQLQAVAVTVTGQRQASAAGLLAVKKNASAVMDGISAEQMTRSPDADAAGAVTRVSGISVVDDKFVVVRGLTERYSNTLLNGVELASPEPTRRVAPLDIFPSSLLESIVAVKTATPDMPGDFAGGSVNIQTKDFPERRVLELKVSQSYNSTTTLKSLPVLRRNGLRDMTGFDGADRFREAPPLELREVEGSSNSLAKSIRNIWSPNPHRVMPDMGLSFQYGNQHGEFERALGYIISFDYGFKTAYEPAEYFGLADQDGSMVLDVTTEHATTTADWGLLGNATLRLGPSHTIGIKNLVTQESEEFVIVGQSAIDAVADEGTGSIRSYQVRYLERGFLQSQLRGQHRFTWPLRTLWNWNATVSQAKRDEPENRSLSYIDDGSTYRVTSAKPNYYWFRFLDDRNVGGNLDLSIPVTRWFFGESEALFKLGAGTRRKKRDFDGYRFSLKQIDDPPDGTAIYSLPPGLIDAPENLGRNLIVQHELETLSYTATDEVRSAYVMADVPLPAKVRLVTGVRMEEWLLDLVNLALIPDTVARRNRDFLFSANLTLPLSDRMNVRAAAYQTLSRPDPREIANSAYTPVTGECRQSGYELLERAQIMNADLRWEWYTGPGELFSLGGFYKFFKDPIVERVSVVESTCGVNSINARTAYSAGAELEMRKGLGFLHSALDNVSAGLNFTYATGAAEVILGNAGEYILTLDLQDLSKYLANASIGYAQPDGGFSAMLLYNYFADRISLYGNVVTADQKTPDIIEKGRGTVDFKLTKRLRGVTASFSGRNLTNQVMRETQLTDAGVVPVGLSRPGMSLSLSLGYAF